MKIQGSWIVLPRNIVQSIYHSVEKDQDFEFGSPANTFQWCFYGDNYIGIFWGFDNWTRPSGRRGNIYELAQGQLLLLCSLSTAESLSCPKSTGSIGGSTIFQGQQYSSCSKAGGCRATQLLEGFRRNLPIVSWVTSTPECTANFPGNWRRVSGRTTFHQFFGGYS
jgi:hypothetical protein